MRRVLILSVSAMAVLATSQAFARDDFVAKSQVTNKSTTKLNIVIPQNKLNGPAGNRTMDTFNKTQNGGLSGNGVPGGLGARGTGSDIAKGAGFKDTSIMPKGTIGAAKDQLTNAKDSANQNKGVQKSDGATVRDTLTMKKQL